MTKTHLRLPVSSMAIFSKTVPNQRPDTTKAAQALHLAVKKLCAENKVPFRRWVSIYPFGTLILKAGIKYHELLPPRTALQCSY